MAAKTSHGVAATASIWEKSEMSTRLSGPQKTAGGPDGRTAPVAQPSANMRPMVHHPPAGPQVRDATLSAVGEPAVRPSGNLRCFKFH